MDAEEYSHVFPTWEIYPRVYYFKNRFIDFNKRFRRVLKALPERFYKKAPLTLLDNLAETLNKHLHLMVLGQEDLSNSQITVSTEALKRYSDIPSSNKEEIHICICYVKERDLGEQALKSIDSILNYLSSTLLDRLSSACAIYIVCETLASLQDDDTVVFRKNILELVPKTINTTNMQVEILLGPTVDDLPSLISKSFEKQIMNGFLEIFSFLQTFIRINNQSGQENVDILSSEYVVNAILDFLRNGHHLIDSKAITENVSIQDLVIESLCHRIMCAAVCPMASKHIIPDWVCHELLDEISFEKDLQKSISSNTNHHLKAVGDNALELIKLIAEGKSDEKTSTSKTYNYDFLLYQLQKDLVVCVTSAEKKLSAMHQLTVVIRKMIFEIKGYLKQTVIEIDIVEIGPRDLTAENISDALRKDILSTEGVYGMGILYGQLEIHLCTGLGEEVIGGVKGSVMNILKHHRFPFSYTIKTVEKKPHTFAGNFYEPGEKLLSPFPDNRTSIRIGTLACFIKDSDEKTYAVTCAHVVDPHETDEHDVYFRSQNHLFAHSSSNLTINVNETDTHFQDFAAIKVLPENENNVSFLFKDESGNNKQGRIISAQSSDLVGSNVFKYGATTGYTRGIVASNSYIFGNELHNDIIIVEQLPLVSDSLYATMTNGYSQTPTQESMPLEFNESSPPRTPENVSSTTVESPSPSQDDNMISVSNICVQTVQCKSKIADTPNCVQRSIAITSLRTSDEQAVTGFKDNFVISLEKSAGCSSRHGAMLPRPEQHKDEGVRDSELNDIRNPNELISEALSDVSINETQVVAANGDSGAMVCRTNISTNEIELISMITAGDFKMHEPLNSGSERKKCLSVSIKAVLDRLGEHCGKEFVLC